MSILLRQENKQDFNAVYTLIKIAFETAQQSDGTEQDLVVELRKSDAFIPELSLVAIIDDTIVGHILFSKIKIGNTSQVALAPLSVLPSYQKQGIGTILMKEGHEIAQKLGYDYSIVLGSEKYYPRLGYVSAENYRIYAPFEVPSQNFMALKLSVDCHEVSGIVEYSSEFGI